jgi:hypothetical protein
LTVAGSAAAHAAHAVRLGERLAQELLAKGARRLIAAVRDVNQTVAAP